MLQPLKLSINENPDRITELSHALSSPVRGKFSNC